MKRMTAIAALAFVLLAGGLLATNQVGAADNVGNVIGRLERNYQTLNSLRSGISMNKYNAQTREGENYQGMLHLIPGKGRAATVRLDWTSPKKEILTLVGGNYVLYNERLNTAYVGKSASVKSGRAGNATEMLNMSGTQLRARFNAADLGDENLWGNVGTSHLRLTPKAKASYRDAEVWVDASGMPVQSKINETNGDSTTIRLINVEKNAQFPTHIFNQDVDCKKVKCIKG